MNVLFFTYDFPYPTTSGGKNRAYNMMKHSAKATKLYLFSFIRSDFDKKYIENIKEIGVKDMKLFKRRAVKDLRNIAAILSLSNSIFRTLYFEDKVLEALIRYVKDHGIDVVLFESYYTAFYINNELRELGVKLIYGTENLEYLIYEDFVKYVAAPWQKPLFFNELRKIRHEEHRMLISSDANLAVTMEEADHIRRISDKPCYLIENGVDLDYFDYRPQKKEKSKQILFVGNFSYFPNIDAMKYFYNDVFLKLTGDDFHLTIIGKDSQRLFLANEERVTCIDYIKDIREGYEKAGVFISPVRIGGGTNFKILEAMAMGVPVVADPARLEGLGVLENENLLVARNSFEFISKIKSIFEEEELCKKLIKNARKHVENRFSWEQIGSNLSKVYSEVLKDIEDI